MLVYKFDGSENGLLCCLFESFVKKEVPYLVTSGEVQISFDSTIKDVASDKQIAARVREGIKKCGSITLLNRIFYLFRSFDLRKETVMFAVARKCLEARRDITFNFADSDVIIFSELSKKIGNEIHRFYGFIRFEKSLDDIWYAHFEPDNDIVDLIAPHFVSRMGTKFILHDVKRNKIAVSDGKELRCFVCDRPLAVYLAPEELSMQRLWKTYYNTVNIEQRKNLRQMRGYMPQRYYKHMPEKQVDTRVVFGGKSVDENSFDAQNKPDKELLFLAKDD